MTLKTFKLFLRTLHKNYHVGKEIDTTDNYWNIINLSLLKASFDFLFTKSKCCHSDKISGRGLHHRKVHINELIGGCNGHTSKNSEELTNETSNLRHLFNT